MANPYFKFKEFTVWQDQCAMKVSTISCLFGALIRHNSPRKILDIGAGTGLLSLMMAQNFRGANIDGIEIETGAFQQAKKNYSGSKWKERLHIIHADFLDYIFSSGYDLIISNPPFFKDHLKTSDKTINLARHRDHFSFEKFLQKISNLLNEKGSSWVLLPEYEMQLVEKLASNFHLFIRTKYQILNFEGTKPIAVVNCFSKEQGKYSEQNIIIRKNKNEYSEEFQNLLKNFYL